jgi:hypothetical protein
MSYEEHIESVIKSLRDFADNKETNLVLLRNHLEQIVCDIIVEINEEELTKEES